MAGKHAQPVLPEHALTSRSAGPDRLKALLLIVVVFGHTYADPVSGSFTKWLIYGFHMPAFLFLSGYLIRAERLLNRGYPQLFSDYTRRMLAPWLLVSLLWAMTFGDFSAEHPVRSMIQLVTLPQWHLWYVPVLFAMISLAWLTVRLPRPYLTLGTLAVIAWAASPIKAENLLDERYFSYLIWFTAGFLARNVRTPHASRALILPGTVGGLVYVWSYPGSPWATSLGFLLLNLCLVAAVPSLLAVLHGPPRGWLVFMGRQSLWVYLLHPFVTTPVQQLGLPGPWQRLAGLATTAAICGVVVVLYRRSTVLGRRTRPGNHAAAGPVTYVSA